MFEDFSEDFELYKKGSFYTVKKVVRKMEGNGSRIIAVYIGYPDDSQFHIKLTLPGINVQNSHLSKMSKKAYRALYLKTDDLPYFEEMFSHWDRIKNNFVQVVAHGAPVIGHTSTTYYYPDGREVNYKAKDNKAPKAVKGKSFDNAFPSDGCFYIEGIPSQQHYKHGRFDFNLEKTRYEIEDSRSIQVLEFEQPEKIIELLKFVEYDPDTAMSRII